MSTMRRRVVAVVATATLFSSSLAVLAREMARSEPVSGRERIAKEYAARDSSHDMVRLAYKSFNPLDGVPSVPAGLKSVAPEYRLVQVDYPATKATRLAIKAAGAEILGALPEVTYIVRADAAVAEKLKDVDRVRWVGAYEPAYKLAPSVEKLDGTTKLRVWAHKGVDARTLAPALAAVSGLKVLQAQDSLVLVEAGEASLAAMARIENVVWIDRVPEYQLHNSNALWVNDTGERDEFNVTKHLTGAGQTAAVADTGINYIPDDNGRAQMAFSDCNADDCKLADYVSGVPGNMPEQLAATTKTNSGHRKMAAYFNLDADDPNARSLEGSWHGTHVSGSVAADYPEADGTYGTRNREADGIAVAARLSFQDIEAEGGLGGLPADPYDLYDQVYDLDGDDTYDPNEDARTHNNSYGAIYPLFDDGGGYSTDLFVRENPDMMIVFSASNDGPGEATLAGGPQESKNIITSCASANGRQPLVSIDAAAVFSSHGPTLDGRLKPDVCTPGQINVSPKGGTVDDDQYLQGTSMSGPMLVGLVTLVRQYFYDGFGPTGIQGFATGKQDFGNRHNPSAALVKATTINSAQRMRGYYTGDEGTERDQDGMWPSAGQGWGKVELDKALFFEGDDRALFTVDRPNDDTSGIETDTEITESIDVAPGQPLDITLAWTDAASPLPAGTPTLVNDLDLVVIGPDGTEYLGNQFNTQSPILGPGGDPALDIGESVTGGTPDIQNNVEGFRLQAPKPGRYQVKVIGSNVQDGPQGYSLAVSGRIATDKNRIVFDAPKYKPGATATAYLLGTGLSGDVVAGFNKIGDSVYSKEITASGSSVTASGGGAEASAPVDGTAPAVSNLLPNSVAADLTFFTWETDEESSGQVVINGPDGEAVFGDVYAVEDFPGINNEQNETKGIYQNKLVVGRKHEAYVTGLKPGVKYTYSIKSVDEAGNEGTSAAGEYASTDAMYSPDAPDIAMLLSGDLTTGVPMTPDINVCGLPVTSCQPWGTSTQLYAGKFGTTTGPVEAMPAFMFRLPPSVDPAKVTGAAVEMYSGHDIVDTYTDHTIYSLDLLDSGVESGWGPGQTYTEVNGAEADVKLSPDPSLRRGANKKYSWMVPCNELEAFKTNLAEDTGDERGLAFRLKASTTHDDSLFSFETGYGRRSRGPQLRPRLVLFMEGLDPQPCVATDAPKISNVLVDHIDATSSVVSWRTDVESDSTVYFRKVGDTEWTPVSAPIRTTNHFIKVKGLEDGVPYEFTVRSATCNGLASVDDNEGKSYALFNEAFVSPAVGDFFARPSPEDPTAEILGFGTDQPTTVVLKYGTSPATMTEEIVVDDPDDATDQHQFLLEGLTACTRYYFQVTAKNAAGRETVSPVQAFDRPPAEYTTEIVSYDFEADAQGWVNTPEGGTGGIGIPFFGGGVEDAPTNWERREAPETGSWVMRTIVEPTDSPGYTSNADQMLVSPPLSVPAGPAAIRFAEVFELEGVEGAPSGTVEPYEQPMVQISYDDGLSWKSIREAVHAQNPDFPDPTTTTLSLPQEAQGKTVRIAFRLRSDTNLEPQGVGWLVDDVKLMGGTCTLAVADPAPPTVPEEKAASTSIKVYRDVVGPEAPVDASGNAIGVLPALVAPPSAASLAAGTCRCTDVRYLGQVVSAGGGGGGGGGGGPIPATGWGSAGLGAAVAGALALVALALRRRVVPAEL